MSVGGIDLGKYQLGWRDTEQYVFKPKKGLNEEIVREISEASQVPVILVGEEQLPQKLARVERVHNRVLNGIVTYDGTIFWLNLVSDAVIATSYYSIPFVLLYFAMRRRDLVFRWMFVMFGISTGLSLCS